MSLRFRNPMFQTGIASRLQPVDGQKGSLLTNLVSPIQVYSGEKRMRFIFTVDTSLENCWYGVKGCQLEWLVTTFSTSLRTERNHQACHRVHIALGCNCCMPSQLHRNQKKEIFSVKHISIFQIIRLALRCMRVPILSVGGVTVDPIKVEAVID